MLPQDNVTLKFLLQATGDLSASDVDLAVASKAIILGFNVRAPGSVKSYAESKGVEIRLYRVIYELIDDVRNAMEGLLEAVEVNSDSLYWLYYFKLKTDCVDTMIAMWIVYMFSCVTCILMCTSGASVS